MRTYVATFTLASDEVQMVFDVLVKPSSASLIEPGRYLLRHVATDTYLTAQPKGQAATFAPLDLSKTAQVWQLERNSSAKYGFISLADTDSLKLNQAGKMAASAYFPFFIDQAVGTDRVAIHTSSSATPKYWEVTDGLIEVTTATALTKFPFQLCLYQEGMGIKTMDNGQWTMDNGASRQWFDLGGRRVRSVVRPGVYVTQGRKVVEK